MSGVPSLESVGISSFSNAWKPLLTPPPSDPRARLCFFHLIQSVLRVISLQNGALGELCSGTLAPLFSSTLLALTKYRDFSFGMGAREVHWNQGVVHKLLLSLCNETLPRHRLLDTFVAPGNLDAIPVEVPPAAASSEKKSSVVEEPPLIVQNVDQMVYETRNARCARYIFRWQWDLAL